MGGSFGNKEIQQDRTTGNFGVAIITKLFLAMQQRLVPVDESGKTAINRALPKRTAPDLIVLPSSI